MKNIRQLILSTSWKVDFGFNLFSHKINNEQRAEYQHVPSTIFQIFMLCDFAIKKDPKGEQDLCLEIFNKVAYLGSKAALHKSISRNEKTQEFYDCFLNSYKQRDNYIKSFVKSR